MLQNARVTAFSDSELLRENQQAAKITPLPPTHIRVKREIFIKTFKVYISVLVEETPGKLFLIYLSKSFLVP